MIEIWKSIIGHENYEVSNLGNIKSLKSNKILKYRFHQNGYAQLLRMRTLRITLPNFTSTLN
jgi:hypothetical protein